jgi:hypothetical protein
MEEKEIVTTNHETTSRSSKTLAKEKHEPQKMDKSQSVSDSECGDLTELQEALQDPITVYEGS